MKKKLLFGLTLILCFALLCACGTAADDTDLTETTEIPDSDEIASSNGSGAVKDRYTVTKDEWEEALSFAKAVPTSAAQYVYDHASVVGEDRFVYYDVHEFGENCIRIVDYDETRTEITNEWFYEKDGDNYYRYYFGRSRYDDTPARWRREVASESNYKNFFERIDGMDGELGITELFSYEDFTYDAENKCYRLDEMVMSSDSESITCYNVILKFKNGLLESYYFEAWIDGYNAAETSFTYDPIEVTLPEAVDEIER